MNSYIILISITCNWNILALSPARTPLVECSSYKTDETTLLNFDPPPCTSTNIFLCLSSRTYFTNATSCSSLTSSKWTMFDKLLASPWASFNPRSFSLLLCKIQILISIKFTYIIFQILFTMCIIYLILNTGTDTSKTWTEAIKNTSVCNYFS